MDRIVKQMIRTYNEAIRISDFIDRFHYLQLFGKVGIDTFGYDRYLNQMFYHDAAWKKARNEAIVRDCGCDLADQNRPILRGLIVHHINPIDRNDVINRDPKLFDLNNLICVSPITHRAIHYGSDKALIGTSKVRFAGDTKMW